MRKCFGSVRLLGVVTALLFGDVTQAVPVSLQYDSLTESKTVLAPLTTANPISVNGLLNGLGSFSNSLTFTASSSALALSAGWLVAPPANRTVGVNIDLFDASNMLVASDTVMPLMGSSVARSQLLANVTAGATYRLVTTGTGLGFGTYHIDVVDGAVPPAAPTVLAATPDLARYRFDTHIGVKTPMTVLTPGSELVIDGIPAMDGGMALTNAFNFRITDRTPLSAGIVWIVNAIGDPLRTTGVNVDIFDSMGMLVVSDAFVGLTDGQAFSRFALADLGPGDYRLLFTGTTPTGGGRYRIDLSANATAPVFVPIDVTPAASVPEPAMVSLAMAGFATVLLMRRRTTARRR